MYIRCASCKTCTRVVFGTMHRGVTCITCGRGYSLSRAEELGSTPDERYRRASEYAASHGTDLASAYSILLGIMSLEDAPSTRDDVPDPSASAAKEPQPAAESGSKPGHYDYDPGFQGAVAEGYLTVWQAEERGDRVLYASRLAQRHGLPMSLAFLVTDNRITLADAGNRVTSIASEASAPGREGSFFDGRGLVAIVLTLVAVFAFTVWGEKPAVGPGQPDGAAEEGGRPVAPPSVQALFETRTNPAGELTEVRGLDPKTVLRAFCQSAAGTARRQPVRAVPSKEDWIGYYRENGALWAIRIRRDPGRGDWVFGNAADPVVPTKASALRAEGAEARVAPRDE